MNILHEEERHYKFPAGGGLCYPRTFMIIWRFTFFLIQNLSNILLIPFDVNYKCKRETENGTKRKTEIYYEKFPLNESRRGGPNELKTV